MKESLHVLHVEDSEMDCELVQNLLRKEGLTCDVKRVDSRAQVFDALQNEPFDLILSDCKLPGFSGQHALEIAHALKPDVPFVFVSGTIGEDAAIESLRNGAIDYVLKDHLSRLGPAVRRALAEAEEHKLCRQLQQRLREAGRLEAVSTLSSGIAHDFNNILTIIMGHASLLAAHYDRPERVLEITDAIARAARRASEVVQQLLAFAHKSDSRMVPISLNRCIQETLDYLQSNLPSNIGLDFKPDDNLPNILADASQMERIIVNLFNNAVDSMPGGGRVTLSTGLIPAAEVPDLTPGLTSDHYVFLKVTDTGRGMDLLTRQHIFEPFYTTKERGRGTGLGLPVVHGLMQAHRGWINVESEPGRGTTFTLFFPALQPDPEVRSPVSPAADPSLNGTETILVVDDEPDVSFFLETVLQSHGYRPILARDHEQALDLLKSHQEEIRLVLSDIGLPRMDGIALCAKLKGLKTDLKIILASGYSSKEFTARMRELGIDAFLPKPYTPQDVLQCVRIALDGATVLHPA